MSTPPERSPREYTTPAGGNPPGAITPREARNKQLVRDMDREVFWRHNFDYLDTLYVEDYIDYDAYPGQKPGLEGFKEAMRAYAEAYPNLHVVLDTTIAEGDIVVIQGFFEGTNTGSFMSVPPSDIHVQSRRCEVVRINDEGKATERWGVGPELKTLQTMNVLPQLSEVSPRSDAGTVAARFGEEFFERDNPAAVADLVDVRARADSKGMIALFQQASALSDKQVSVQHARASGARTANITVHVTGRHTGMGFASAPTDRQETTPLTVVARVAEGKISDMWVDRAPEQD